ncbi:hypothetical protein [Diaminobutyricimonas sp. LJ205]|uniref:hypothetical protein n=1 Tax=Diaminobutyricimonas sp. LJ205 TaxID=2683590 RepID=UPI0012F515EB|nr:hypothetical protein [Diaminobutyricimonas sp. LJ205]
MSTESRSSTATTPGSSPATAPASRRRRYVTFRIAAVVAALTFLVLFNALPALLTPWVDFADTTDHGWARTPELHRVADSGAALLMTAVAAASVILAVRPTRNAATTMWLISTLTMIFLMSIGSSAIQGHDLMVAVITAAILLGVFVVPLALLSPDRRSLLRAGVTQAVGSAAPRPSRLVLLGLSCLMAAGPLLGVGVIAWRLSGGVFEAPQEDDVIGLAMLGASVALGAWLCLRAHEGWRALAILLLAMTAYAVAAGVSLALA